MKKHFLFSSLLALVFFAAGISMQAQTTNPVGEITYLEGQVKLLKDGVWAPAQIKDKVFANQTVQTASDGAVEIKWVNSAKTVVGASSKQGINVLYENSARNTKNSTGSLFSGIKKLMKSGNSGKQEEGGIRRALADAPADGKGELVWKADEEMTFERASSFYQGMDYMKSVKAFSMFLEQKPQDANAKFAMFALAHSYIELNNSAKAKELLEKFIATYPGDSLAQEAKQILAQL